MDDLLERKQLANKLRKALEYEKALPLYRDLWNETEDCYEGAGLLHCLRKLQLFDEAIPFANELVIKYPDFNWCRTEAIWTYIQGILGKFNENDPTEDVIEEAKKIMALNPDGLATKIIVFKVLKSAKTHNHWNIVNEWVIKIDPDSLSSTPMKDESGREGWSDQSLWYNYRINGLIETGTPKEAIILVDKIVDRFPRQRKFFLRLKASALHRDGALSESEKIYCDLCSGYNPDWWLLHEYGNVVRDNGRKEDALKLMYEAANSQPKLELLVSLLVDIGILCKELSKNEEARAHLALCKLVRKEKGWSIPDVIEKNLEDINKIISNSTEPSSIKEALYMCRSEWKKVLANSKDMIGQSSKKRIEKRGLIGKVSLGRNEQNFCFIFTKDRDSYFCLKSNLPIHIKNGDIVTFDAIPSFDKKKKKES